jgi:hypothetical protein
LLWRRLLRTSLFALGAATTTCTPFKEDPSRDSGLMGATPASEDAFASPGDLTRVADGGLDAGNGLACDPTKPFGPPTFLQGLANTGATNIGGLRLSPDSLTAYFYASYPAHSGSLRDLYSASRVTSSAPFDMVAPLGDSTVNTFVDEANPTVSGDGLTLIFERFYSGTPRRLHYAARTKRSVPFTYGGPIGESNPAAQDTSPLLREDGRVLYFASSRKTGIDYDIYRAAWNGTSLDSVVQVAELNTVFDDVGAVVTPDDLTIYFSSNRPPHMGPGWDIWRAARISTSDPFSAPTNVAELNSPDIKQPTFVSPDGCTVYFDTLGANGDAQYLVQRPHP